MAIEKMLEEARINLGAALVAIEDAAYGGYSSCIRDAGDLLIDASVIFDEIVRIDDTLLEIDLFQQADDRTYMAKLDAVLGRAFVEETDLVECLNKLHDMVTAAIGSLKEYQNAYA